MIFSHIMAKAHLRTVREIVKAFGGPKKLAEWAAVVKSAPSNWVAEGHIPPGWHYRLHLELSARGYKIDPRAFGVRLPKAVTRGRAKRTRRDATGSQQNANGLN